MIHNITRNIGNIAIALPAYAYTAYIFCNFGEIKIYCNVSTVFKNRLVGFNRKSNNPGVFVFKKRLNVRCGKYITARSFKKLLIKRSVLIYTAIERGAAARTAYYLAVFTVNRNGLNIILNISKRRNSAA